jgi:deoxyribodipyrimidine photo-lyase
MKNCYELNIIWLKRDLRLHDHKPLCEAIEANEPTLLLYIFEPSVQQYPDWNIRHWRFVWQSLVVMNEQLKPFNTQINIFHDEVIPVFENLMETGTINTVFSYQEIGTKVTFDRDKSMHHFFKKNGIKWRESPTNGIIRGLKHRKNWDKQFTKMVIAPIQNPNLRDLKLKPINTDKTVNNTFVKTFPELLEQPAEMQKGGERLAWRYLRTFLQERGRNYSKNISKPANSRKSCSRISPYLAWGNLSIRQVYQFTQSNLPTSPFKRDLYNFASRLHWHCHFIQKFEAECRMEFEHINRGIKDQLSQPLQPELLEAWKNGQTGFPLIDACMRCVKATGYLNFRMRACCVSFLTHHLWQPWQSGSYHLAQQFLDYEPGIHFPQFQMQAGVTGSNTIRSYNPIKQSIEKDADGVFIRKWVKELVNVPIEFLHEPYKMTMLEQQMYGCIIGEKYPKPIVNNEKAGKHARDILWNLKGNAKVRSEKKRILAKHVSPNRWKKGK